VVGVSDGEHRPVVVDDDEDDIETVTVVTDDDAGDDEADDELENISPSFDSLAVATFTKSSPAAARVSASIGLALASMSPPEASPESVDDESFGQLTESCSVVESGKDFCAAFFWRVLNLTASHCASLCT